MPDFKIEDDYGDVIVGVDEVGRGPLAGPVVAAAVFIPPENRNHPVWSSVQDSKKLSAARRDVLYSVIQGQCMYGIAEASVSEIDSMNILQATFLAMERAIQSLAFSFPFQVLIDGNRAPKNWNWPCKTLVKGDSLSVSIAAASILAKVTRDRHMTNLANQFPHYGWDSNAGYGTAAHLHAITTHGITMHHRRSFAPIKGTLAA